MQINNDKFEYRIKGIAPNGKLMEMNALIDDPEFKETIKAPNDYEKEKRKKNPTAGYEIVDLQYKYTPPGNEQLIRSGGPNLPA